MYTFKLWAGTKYLILSRVATLAAQGTLPEASISRACPLSAYPSQG